MSEQQQAKEESKPAQAIQKREKAPVAMEERGLVLRDLTQAWRFCEAVVESKLGPSGLDTPAKVLIAMQTGMEAGLSHMASLRALWIAPDNRPSWYSEAIKAVIIRSPMCLSWKEGVEGEGEDRFGWVESHRAGQPAPNRTTFSMAQATRMEVRNKANWKKDPDGMLLHRASGRHGHRWYPDLLLGLPVGEEAYDRNETVTREAPDVDRPAALPYAQEVDPLFQNVADGVVVASEPPTTMDDIREAAARAVEGDADALRDLLRELGDDPAIASERLRNHPVFGS